MSTKKTNRNRNQYNGIPFEDKDLPVASLKQSREVPNFKESADKATGVVEEQRLNGAYERLGTAPIVVWKRRTGEYEVVTGRHRLDLARRNGEATIPCHVVNEADGFTAKLARVLDAESNIRDGQGTLRDYVLYFKNEPSLPQAEAQRRGLLSRTSGKGAWTIARESTADTFTAWLNGIIDGNQAVAIAEGAPSDEGLQRNGIHLAIKHLLCAEEIRNAITALRTLSPATLQKLVGGQLDLFGTTNPDLCRAAVLAQQAKATRLELTRKLYAIEGPVQRSELAARCGVTIRRKARKLVPELKQQIEQCRNFARHPEIYKQLASQLAAKVKKAQPFPPTPVSANRAGRRGHWLRPKRKSRKLDKI
jgi:hypothetical protein